MPIKGGRWRQCNQCGKLIPVAEWENHIGGSTQKVEYHIQGDIESFKSPIDGTVISDRAQLREHMRRHGVTDSRDYSESFMKEKARQRHSRMTGQDAQGKRERIETILKAIAKHGG